MSASELVVDPTVPRATVERRDLLAGPDVPQRDDGTPASCVGQGDHRSVRVLTLLVVSPLGYREGEGLAAGAHVPPLELAAFVDQELVVRDKRTHLGHRP